MRDQIAPPGMFNLSELYPGWHGQLADLVRPRLAAGIRELGKLLGNAPWAVLDVVTTVWFDGLSEDVQAILPAHAYADGEEICRERLRAKTREVLARRPVWSMSDKQVLRRSIMPATREVLDGDALPLHVCGSSYYGTSYYDQEHARYFVVSTRGELDPLPNLFSRLEGTGRASFERPLVFYLESLGKDDQ